MRFAIDNKSINLNMLEAPQARHALHEFIGNIARINNEGHGICYDEELFGSDLWHGATFWELFSNEANLQLSYDDLELAAATFGTMARWHELPPPQPDIVEVSIDGNPLEIAGSIAWAHAQSGQGLASCACLCAPHGRAVGLHRVLVEGSERSIWFVSSSQDVECYFRYLLASYAVSPDNFMSLALYAFRNLLFVERCFGGIRSMGRSCRDLAPEIVAHLSAFSDNGQEFFSGPWKDVPAKFGSLGVNISDENGRTKKNKEASSRRIRNYDGKDLYFWWHSKIEPHRDRIHICPDKVPNGGKIIVGIFCLHLV